MKKAQSYRRSKDRRSVGGVDIGRADEPRRKRVRSRGEAGGMESRGARSV